MKRLLYLAALSATMVVVVFVAFLVVRNMFSTKPANLGVRDGRFAPCPSSPNCVSTQANDPPHTIEPIAWQGSSEAAVKAIKATLAKMPRTTIITAEGNYLHAEARSLLFRFVDDVEFLIVPEQRLIHFRSASRIGYSDLGANRARMEQFRKLFAEQSGAN
jgi:uncharacterized protein (DUF1499 family)